MKKPLLITIILLIRIIHADAQPSTAEYNALIDLYNSTNGANWTNKTGWATANPNVVQSVAGWYGVVVDQQGHVIQLFLQGNSLTGPLPSSLGTLSNLTHLVLNLNQITGSIPTELGNLPSLTVLDINNNQLTGSIPSSLGNLPNILSITLAGNQLSGPLPTQLGGLSTLQHLKLYTNNLTGTIPTSFGGLSSLRELFLSGNSLTGPLPSSLGALSNLTHLVLNVNQITGSIPELGSLASLTVLDISNNQLTGSIPPSLGSLPNIISISLANNQLSGILPTQLGSLTTLQHLGLHTNNLTGTIPTSFGGMSSLRELFLSGNSLTGPLPSSLGMLNNLTHLVLNLNQITGSIPAELGNLASLTVLDINNNQLTGSIPTSLGSLQNIVSIDIAGNQLIGTLPSQLGSLTTLQHLFLHSNDLTGTIPTSFGGLSSLRELFLSGNSLTGTLPSSLGALSNLTHLLLNLNQITGSIPSDLGNLTNLKVLDFSSNQFIGPVPSSFGNLVSLQYLHLGGNQLSNIFPESLNNATGLTEVDVSTNKFTFSDLLGFKQNYSDTFFYAAQGAVGTENAIETQIGASFTLTATIDRNTTPSSVYQWFKIVNGVTSALNSSSTTSHTHTISSLSATDASAVYYYTITNSVLPNLTLESSTTHPLLTPTSGNINYVRTTTVTVEGKTTPEEIASVPIQYRTINYAYFDGLGRPMQNVVQQGSPMKNDIVQPIFYDDFGRENRKFLPFVAGNDASYKPNEAIVNAAGQYIGIAQPFYAEGSNNDIADDNRPFSEIMFEPSPLNRPEKEYGTGEAWSPVSGEGNNKFIRHQYLSNAHSLSGSTSEETVIAWKINEEGLPEREAFLAGFVEEGGYYSSNQLSIKGTIDENGNAVREYTNKQGQIILKKVQAVPTPTNLNNIDQWACTYYIYDDLDNLAFVLPPEGVKQFLSLSAQN